MVRSLRWRLQFWHAAVLAMVLIIFGVFVYVLQWQTRLQQVDAELDRTAAVLMSRVRGLFPVPRIPTPGQWPPRPRDRGPGPSRSNSGERSPETNFSGLVSSDTPADALRPANETPLASRSWPRDGSPEGPRGEFREPKRSPWMMPPPGLGLPDEFKHLFEGEGDSHFYFMIWDRSGTVLAKSDSVGDVPFPGLHTQPDGLPIRSVRMRDTHREVIHVSRFDLNVLVGRSLVPELAAQHRSGILLGATGLGVLAVGLIGGWWLSSRAIRPIAEMSAIAESISARNLSNRISVKSTATELEQLATVLNHTFDRLQSAFERQGQFTADASHELRTPLTVILSHAELALSRPRTGEEYQSALEACRRASLRMKTLIDSLLLLARYDSGQPVAPTGPIELDRLTAEAIELLRPLAEDRNIQISSQTEAVAVSVDREQMFRVLTNLLTNAIRYNRAEGRIQVEVAAENGDAVLRVSDTGIGIPATDLPRIFDRFYRVDKARSRVEGGCGLGLAICQSIVEAHGGTIFATSDPEIGTTIEVRLPRATVSLRKETEHAATVSNERSLTPVAAGQ